VTLLSCPGITMRRRFAPLPRWPLAWGPAATRVAGRSSSERGEHLRSEGDVVRYDDPLQAEVEQCSQTICDLVRRPGDAVLLKDCRG
jgi:hypothetical protein